MLSPSRILVIGGDNRRVLALARRRLGDAVAAFVDPIPVHTDDGYRWRAGLYEELRSRLTGQPIRRRTQQRSRPPLRVEVLALLIEIDGTAACWEPRGKDTVEGLRAITARSYRPQDCRSIDDYIAQLQRWGDRCDRAAGTDSAGVSPDGLPNVRPAVLVSPQ